MRAPRSAERLLLFTDAVVAIAITLLVLPLVDSVSTAAEHAHGSAVELVTANLGQFYSFLLSFVVIARFWRVHHVMFTGVVAVPRALAAANLGWLLVIVLLPYPTELIGVYEDDRFVALLYIGTVLVGSLFQTLIVLLLRYLPGTHEDGAAVTSSSVFLSVGSSVALALALGLTFVVPQMQYGALLLLLLVRAVGRMFGFVGAEHRPTEHRPTEHRSTEQESTEQESAGPEKSPEPAD